jgi:hypothetical protein
VKHVRIVGHVGNLKNKKKLFVNPSLPLGPIVGPATPLLGILTQSLQPPKLVSAN